MHHRAVIALVVWCSIAWVGYSQDDAGIKISHCPGLLIGVAYHNQTAPVIWRTPTATEGNSIISNPTMTPSLAGEPPYRFPIGQHLITYRFTSTTGATKDCAFSVFVMEKVQMLESPLKQIFLPTGQIYQLPCHATSSHGARYVWTKNDAELKPSERILWSEDRPGLVIRDTVVEDSGTYTCTAFAAKDEAIEATSVNSVLGVSNGISWTSWSEWSVCYSCDKGTRTRQRSCETPEGNIALLGCDGINALAQNCSETCSSETPAPKKRIHTKLSDTIFGKMAILGVICFFGAAFCCGGILVFGILLERKKRKKKLQKKKAKLDELEKSLSADASPGESANEAEALIDDENEINRHEIEEGFDYADSYQQPTNYEDSVDNYNEETTVNYEEHEMSYGDWQDEATIFPEGNENADCSADMEENLVMAQATEPEDGQLKTAHVKQIEDWSPTNDN